MAHSMTGEDFKESILSSGNLSSRFLGYFSSAPGILSVSLMAVAIPLNALYIHQTRKSSKGNVNITYIKMILAVSNIVVAVCLTACYIWIAILPPGDIRFGNSMLPYVFAGLWQSLLLLGVACDRYIAVIKPLHYHMLVTKTRVVVFATGTCLIGIVFASMMLLVPGITVGEFYDLNGNVTLTLNRLYTPGYDAFLTSWLVILMLIGLVMWGMYIPILITIRKQHRAVQQQMSNQEQSTGTATSHKGTIMLCAAMIYFTISYIPTMAFVRDPKLRTPWLGSQEMMIVGLGIIFSSCSSCILNPFFYGLRLRNCLRS